jgi:hypothetical protein
MPSDIFKKIGALRFNSNRRRIARVPIPADRAAVWSTRG